MKTPNFETEKSVQLLCTAYNRPPKELSAETMSVFILFVRNKSLTLQVVNPTLRLPGTTATLWKSDTDALFLVT